MFVKIFFWLDLVQNISFGAGECDLNPQGSGDITCIPLFFGFTVKIS
jgi:hypothetical protein